MLFLVTGTSGCFQTNMADYGEDDNYQSGDRFRSD